MNLLEEDALSLLPDDMVRKAVSMSRSYQYLYCLENLLRLYVDEHSSKQTISIPETCRKIVKGRKEEELKHKWTSVRSSSDLYYLDFKDLIGVIVSNWPYFEKDFPSQTWIIGKLEDMARCRNMIAHNSYLLKEEQELISINFNLIVRQLGLSKLRIPMTATNINPFGVGFVEGLEKSEVWTHQQAFKGAEYSLNYPASLEVTPILLKSFFEQTSIKFDIIFDNARVRLFPKFKFGRRLDIEEEFWFKDHVIFQVGQYDIDGDGIGELFICVQDYQEGRPGGGLEIKVFKYYPPVFRKHSFRAENWEIIGDFPFDSIGGEPKAYIKDASIKVPRNLRGFYYQWTYVEGQFRSTGFW